jgi:hypothetical protein
MTMAADGHASVPAPRRPGRPAGQRQDDAEGGADSQLEQRPASREEPVGHRRARDITEDADGGDARGPGATGEESDDQADDERQTEADDEPRRRPDGVADDERRRQGENGEGHPRRSGGPHPTGVDGQHEDGGDTDPQAGKRSIDQHPDQHGDGEADRQPAPPDGRGHVGRN